MIVADHMLGPKYFLAIKLLFVFWCESAITCKTLDGYKYTSNRALKHSSCGGKKWNRKMSSVESLKRVIRDRNEITFGEWERKAKIDLKQNNELLGNKCLP